MTHKRTPENWNLEANTHRARLWLKYLHDETRYDPGPVLALMERYGKQAHSPKEGRRETVPGVRARHDD